MIRERVGIKTEKTDRSGNVVGVTTRDVSGCVVWPRKSAEGEQGRVVLSGWNVKLPPGSGPIPASAKLVVRGRDYELFGNVADYGRKGLVAQCRSAGQQ